MTPTAASASTRVLSETFETSSADSWVFDGNCGFCGYVKSDLSGSHTGTRYAYITTLKFAGYFASVGKGVHLSWGAQHTCTASLYLKSFGITNVEVIDPTTWRYVALKSLATGTGGVYQFQTLAWRGGPSDVYFRVSIVGNGDGPDNGEGPKAGVDDIAIDCA
jgi:hypothetical protein